MAGGERRLRVTRRNEVSARESVRVKVTIKDFHPGLSAITHDPNSLLDGLRMQTMLLNNKANERGNVVPVVSPDLP